MSKQKIIIKIENYKPSLVYQPEEEMNRTMHTYDMELGEMLQQVIGDYDITEEIGGETSLEQADSLFQLAEQGDEVNADDFPEVGLPKDTKIKKQLKAYKKNLEEDKSELYDQVEDLDEEVRKELRRNYELDNLAAISSYLHFILIAHALYFASDLGVGVIALEDDAHNILLRTRLARATKEFDAEMEILE